jgi:hypothetical protein
MTRKQERRPDSWYGEIGHRHRLAVGAGGKSRPAVSAAGRGAHTLTVLQNALNALIHLSELLCGFAAKLRFCLAKR